VDAGLKIDMPPNLPPDGAITVSDSDVDDCSTSVAVAASPVTGAGAAWSCGWSLAEEPQCVALTMAYPRVTETNNTAIQGSSQRALVRVVRANPLERVMARLPPIGPPMWTWAEAPPPSSIAAAGWAVLTAPRLAMAMVADLCTRIGTPQRGGDAANLACDPFTNGS
jgi:hypothetical protein